MRGNMKKIIAIVLCIGLCLGLCGCGATSVDSEKTEQLVSDERFVKILDDVIVLDGRTDVDIYVDTETGVMYFITITSYGIDMTPVIGVDGKPLRWEGELK